MRVIIVAGGTGGHIYPGLALAQTIKARDKNAAILFLGCREGLQLLDKTGFEVKYIRARALLRTLSYKAISAPFVSLIGFFQSLIIIKGFQPKLIVSTGGFTALPVILAAKVLGLPIIVLEQNVFPGLVTRLTQKFAQKCFLSFEESLKYIKGEVCGNPVRQEIITAAKEECRRKLQLPLDKKVVLIMGGSQGSKKINEIILAALRKLPTDIHLLHIIGQRDYNWAMAQIKENHNYHPFRYLDNIEQAIAAADLVVSRAGATAIAEFLAARLPMILIPFPAAADNHQQLNARLVATSGCGTLVEEKDFTVDKFISLITQPSLDYDKMKLACAKLAKPEAAKRIVDWIYA